ncbi:MAG: aminotransferase class I/II-fold pyridoxal phosphate-dependent enzyme [Flavobacteriales bacterium]|nr:aminotransferase class I/II-fold pyridoxal phosphate-dependent enzyme [Flavobacteriales bacterium]
MKIDLRSDTVTKPTKEMMDAMYLAPVGDDVFEEDPTVMQLEESAAKLFGKEAGIYCPSGTMTNQIAIRIHTQIGSEVICDKLSHIYNYEGGGIAVNSLSSVKLMEGDGGRFTADDVIKSIQPDDIHAPITSMVAIENTSNKGGGCTWDLNEIEKMAIVCVKNDLPFHLDGARIFNALVAKNENAIDHGKYFDTISICLSKGLGAPIGSVLLGTKKQIHQARRIRKVLGGGVRQVGILAAAGLYALENNVNRLADDHKRANQIAEVLTTCSFVKEVLPVETNILVFDLNDDVKQTDFIQQLKEKDILVVGFGPQRIRFVTHLDFDDAQMESLIGVLKGF